MKIAVVADTHDNCKNIAEIVKVANEQQCDLLLHCGDIVSPFAVNYLEEFQGEVRAIFGNNDGELFGLERSFSRIGGQINQPPYRFQIGSSSLLMLHDPCFLDELILSQNYDFIFYGHLHNEEARLVNRTLVINPGDGSGWLKKATFYIVEVESKNFIRYSLDGRNDENS